MLKRKNPILALILILIIIVSFQGIYRQLFFNDISRNGQSVLYLEISSDQDMGEVIEFISKETDIEAKDFKIELKDDEMEIRFELITSELMNGLDTLLKNEFGDRVFYRGHTLIGKSKLSSSYYIISFIMLSIVLSTIVFVLVKVINYLRRNRKWKNTGH